MSFIIRNALVRFVNLENSVVVWMYGGSERQSEVPAKLNLFEKIVFISTSGMLRSSNRYIYIYIYIYIYNMHSHVSTTILNLYRKFILR